MSHTFEVSDDEFAAIVEAARERGQDASAFFRAWIASVQAYVADGTRDPDQAWFWTAEWQVKEHEADADLAAGRYTRYDSDEAFLDALEERSKNADS
jgi:hypothetical protein